jgi:hypothetical protein
MVGFLEKLLSFFGWSKSPATEKKKALKRLVKNLAKNKYSRFYKAKAERFEPALGKSFYDIYRIVGPAQVFVQNALKSTRLKHLTIEAVLNRAVMTILARLTPESMAQEAEILDPKGFTQSIHQALEQLDQAFDINLINSIDKIYNLILCLIRFISFDYYVVLKKFDPYIPERNFKYEPHFGSVRGTLLVVDLKDFLEYVSAIDSDMNWDIPTRVLKAYMGDMDVITAIGWTDLRVYIRELRETTIMELMIRHVEKDLEWKVKTTFQNEKIAETWLNAKREETKAAIESVLLDKRNNEICGLAKAIFGSPDITGLTYYTRSRGDAYIQKGFAGFVHASCLNYVKAFLIVCFSRDIKDLCELLIIRGHWVEPSQSLQLSESYHSLFEYEKKLNVFDESLADNGTNGAPLFNALPKCVHEKHLARQIRVVLEGVNNEAGELVDNITQAFTVIGWYLKNALADYNREYHDMLANWYELGQGSEIPLPERLKDSLNKVDCFVQMMKIYCNPQEEEN